MKRIASPTGKGKIYLSYVLNARGTAVGGNSDIGSFCLKDSKFSLGQAIFISLSILLFKIH